MNSATIITHQGFGDLFNSNAICHYYADRYEKLIVFASNQARLEVIKSMYQDRQNISCEIPKVHRERNGIDTCLTCMSLGESLRCPNILNTHCSYIDYSFYPNHDHIKIGGFNNYPRWSSFLLNQQSFAHAFYTYENLNPQIRIDKFSISKNITRVESPTILNGLKYTIVHEDRNRRLVIRPEYLTLPIYHLNQQSVNLIDQISIIENSTEIHMIDSSYSVLIYFLAFHNPKIANIPKFLHLYATPSRTSAHYINPSCPNFFIIT